MLIVGKDSSLAREQASFAANIVEPNRVNQNCFQQSATDPTRRKRLQIQQIQNTAGERGSQIQNTAWVVARREHDLETELSANSGS